jgi:hypothetical protein
LVSGRHRREVAGRLLALLIAVSIAVLGFGAWTGFGMAGHGAGPGPENYTWTLATSSIGVYGPFRERTTPRPMQSSPSGACVRGEGNGAGCGDPTGMPEPITLLLFGAMLAGLGVVVRWGLRGRAGSI